MKNLNGINPKNWKLKRKEVKQDIKDKQRTAEIFGVFASHNFYAGGFTPEELRTTLEDLGPTYVKIGQIMSSRSDLLPEAYCRELEKLRSNVRPLESALVRQVIEEETGRRIDELYREFRDAPLGSASIAQAHYGVLKDGTRVVTKVQRPGVADMMRKDFVLLKKIAGLIGAARDADNGSTINLKSVIKELEKVTEEELDFRVEADHTRQFRENCIEDEGEISCPTIIDALTTERILTMTYVDGYSLAKKERIEADGIDRTAIGRAIGENFLHQVLDIGTFHGDPHQGNIMIQNGVPYWIDFGMIGHVDDDTIDAIQDLLFALLQQDTDAFTTAAPSIGRASGPLDKSKLTDDFAVLMERYATVKSMDALNLGGLLSDVTAVLTKYQIKIPGEYTMLGRSLVTIQGVLSEFSPDLNLFALVTEKIIERVKSNFDLREKLTSAVEFVAKNALHYTQLPMTLFNVLKNLARGRLKINLELTGYEGLLDRLDSTIRDVVLAVFACVLFSGSCTLCTTSLEPQASGVPLLAIIGFVVSVALALFTIRNMVKKK